MVNLRKNVISKKAYKYLMNVPRHAKRIFKNKERFIILCNSFPKSGTYLLFQILRGLPNVKDWGYFLASTPSFSYSERAPDYVVNKLRKLSDLELIGGHIFYNQQVDTFITASNINHYFIYRDPRDVVISEANYLYDMNRFHRLHKYFKYFPNLDDRIMFSIQGNSFYQTSVNYLNVKERFEKYEGWLSSKEVFTVRYEDLIGSEQQLYVSKILHYYMARSGSEYELEALLEKALANINPQHSHTFREGGTGKWKKYFNDKHKKIFKDIAGDLLIDLGYENNYNW